MELPRPPGLLILKTIAFISSRFANLFKSSNKSSTSNMGPSNFIIPIFSFWLKLSLDDMIFGILDKTNKPEYDNQAYPNPPIILKCVHPFFIHIVSFCPGNIGVPYFRLFHLREFPSTCFIVLSNMTQCIMFFYRINMF